MSGSVPVAVGERPSGAPQRRPRKGRTTIARASTWSGVADVAAMLSLAAVGLAGFWHVFPGSALVPAAALGALAGTAIGMVGAARRWGPLPVACATVVSAFLFGGPAAYRDTLVAGVLPSRDTLAGIAAGAVRSWKGVVTVPTPVVAQTELVLVPFLAALVGTVLAVSFALRLRRHGWALLPVALLLAGGILLGTDRAVAPVLQGEVFVVVAGVWLAWRRATARAVAHDAATSTAEALVHARRLRLRTIRRGAIMVGGIAALVGFVGPLAVGADGRYVVRDTIRPPLDLQQYPSPLVAFRHFVKDDDQTVLFTVAGLPDGARLRLAVLDTYTGTVMDVAGGDRGATSASGSFGVAGTSLASEGVAVPDGDDVGVDVTVGGYTGAWVPSVGVPTSITFGGGDADALRSALYGNPETGTLISTALLGEGDTYHLDAVLPAPTSPDELTDERPVADGGGAGYVLASAAGTARTLVGDEAQPAAQLRMLRDALTTDGVLSDGLVDQLTSRAGHGAERVEALLGAVPMVGDDEQYAVAAALMARSLGYRARVVMGFYPGQGAERTADGAVEILGTDTHAWLEVDFGPAGWVPYDVTPTQLEPPPSEDPRAVSEPQLQHIQEPPPAQEPNDVPDPPIAAEQDAEQPGEGSGLGGILAIVAAVTGPVLVLLGPLFLVVHAKSRRRRRRRTAPDPVDRMSGGWRELSDAAADLGLATKPGATRRETANQLRECGGGDRVLVVGDHVDRAVFGAVEPTDEQVAQLWAEVDEAIGEIAGTTSTWRRLRARVSVRSLRVRERLARVVAGVRVWLGRKAVR